ncbi:DUF6308 family protein [Arthrobacter sp. A2-55]|uniref:DUF6308 family protein n=1 Tax=Arthrobacter sp. A2-55 TaxID=2897337 RepID=UPI003977C946
MHSSHQVLGCRTPQVRKKPQTTASKILTRKRPLLVPIYDSVFAKQVGILDSGGQWLSRWEASCAVADYC